MVRIAITGASGNVGLQATAAFDDTDHEVTPITHNPSDEFEDEVTLDVADAEQFREALADHDVLVHLAANPSPDADWESLAGPNVEGVYNAYEAAVANDLDRVVFASSNHAIHGHNIGEPDKPESLAEDARAVRPDDPPFPDSYYGVSKVLGEAMGGRYALRHGLEVVNLRIGWLLSAEDLAAQVDDESVDSRFARAMWLSPRDCRAAIRAATTAELPTSPLVVHAVSRNDERYLSLTEAARTVGYHPRDDAAEALDET